MDILTEDLIKLGIAILVGGLVGAEREFRDKAGGFRTLILITVGSTLFTIFALRMTQALLRPALPRTWTGRRADDGGSDLDRSHS